MTIADLIEFKINYNIDGIIFENDKYPDYYFEIVDERSDVGDIFWKWGVHQKWKINLHSVNHLINLYSSGCVVI